MGCVSSKHFKKELTRDIILNNGGDYINHVVSLTSSTYGVLDIDNERRRKHQEQPVKEIVVETAAGVKRSPPRDEPEVINAWELMEGLEEGVPMSVSAKKSPRTHVFLRGLADKDGRSPLKFLSQIGSPKKVKRFGGKENRGQSNVMGSVPGRSGFSPKQTLKTINSLETPSRAVLRLSFPVKSELSDSGFLSQRRQSFSPLFDPDLVASYEKELCEEGEQIKMIISPAPQTRKLTKSQEYSEKILQSFEKICPPRGENAVVIYTTTLRGIRKTFEDCNTVRSIIGSHNVQMLERDISMDSGFKEDLRALMGKKEVKIPLVFVKGRLIGGADEVVKLEEEGKLGILLEEMPRGIGSCCEGCGGVRFLMCVECNGSCKVMDEQQKKMVKCGECNENGLIQCPICC
ncbi:uncharacterized protein At3g28850 [Carica papaya]|uniref:uncharacterized protein At3g28850 n=1 Tax=Carica papaya TaxID=3649 RepID=UPI000B8CBE6D|nr:uncharacterized protein At3g28850 [Carica papaya]